MSALQGSYAKYYLYGSGKTTPEPTLKNKIYNEDVLTVSFHKSDKHDEGNAVDRELSDFKVLPSLQNCPPPYYGMLYFPPPMPPPSYTSNVQGSPRDGFYTPAARHMGQYSPFFGSPKSPLRFKVRVQPYQIRERSAGILRQELI